MPECKINHDWREYKTKMVNGKVFSYQACRDCMETKRVNLSD